eukprot:comp24121_c1_seq1/m.43736 comp24121_c1_seq1/g.43736  ORF comp24121_c1_seq1/g.43736 comp24121_c1_seq1/m.43736 type:complete len:537 (-) comp24121_c1_seq1:233-1843(-)
MTSRYRVNYQLTTHKRDNFIEFIKSLLLPVFVLRQDRALYESVFETVAKLVDDHREWQNAGNPEQSRLFELVPTIGQFFTSLPLKQAFRTYDMIYHVSQREHVPPSFNDIRKILGIAQVHAVAKTLRLVTFDGDETLYPDGHNFNDTNQIADQIVQLLKCGLHVAIVTAAGDASNPARYEERLAGLLQKFRRSQLSAVEMGRFYVMGGECNYLYETMPDGRLREVGSSKFYLPAMQQWAPDHIKALMDTAEKSFQDTINRLGLPAIIYRKERGIGLCRKTEKTRISRENLDEVVLRAKYALDKSRIPIPFCAFNGGADAWVDVGNKLIGVQVLQAYVGSTPSTTLHIGDQFLSTGNDHATRTACTTAWISNPAETEEVLNVLLELIDPNFMAPPGAVPAYPAVTPPSSGADLTPTFKAINLPKPPQRREQEAVMQGPNGTVTIELEVSSVERGDCVVMVGAKAGLGSWNAFDAPVLQRVHGHPNLFTIALQPQGDEIIEFNFAKISALDQAVTWMPGENQSLRPNPNDVTLRYKWL